MPSYCNVKVPKKDLSAKFFQSLHCDSCLYDSLRGCSQEATGVLGPRHNPLSPHGPQGSCQGRGLLRPSSVQDPVCSIRKIALAPSLMGTPPAGRSPPSKGHVAQHNSYKNHKSDHTQTHDCFFFFFAHSLTLPQLSLSQKTKCFNTKF